MESGQGEVASDRILIDNRHAADGRGAAPLPDGVQDVADLLVGRAGPLGDGTSGPEERAFQVRQQTMGMRLPSSLRPRGRRFPCPGTRLRSESAGNRVVRGDSCRSPRSQGARSTTLVRIEAVVLIRTTNPRREPYSSR